MTVSIALLFSLASMRAFAEEPRALLCVDRLVLGRPGYTESQELYRDRAVRVSVDGGPPARVDAKSGTRFELDAGPKRHRYVVRYVSGRVYESDRFEIRAGQELCLYYRPIYGHFELTSPDRSRSRGRCADCPKR